MSSLAVCDRKDLAAAFENTALHVTPSGKQSEHVKSNDYNSEKPLKCIIK